jgi:hypothetical protein
MQAEPVADEVVQVEPATEAAPTMQRRTRRPLGQCDSVLLTAYNQSGKTSAILTDKKATAASTGMHGDDNNDNADSENAVPVTEGTKTAAKSKSKRYVNTAFYICSTKSSNLHLCTKAHIHTRVLHQDCLHRTYTKQQTQRAIAGLTSIAMYVEQVL